jgi:hypothetical protein
MSPPALRPGTSDGAINSLSIPSRTSSLHSRIVQPLPSTLKMTPVQPTRTLCYAYAVFGIPPLSGSVLIQVCRKNRTTGQRLPQSPAAGKSLTRKAQSISFTFRRFSAVVLASNKIMKLRVLFTLPCEYLALIYPSDSLRHHSPMTSKSLHRRISLLVLRITLLSNRIRLIHFTECPFEYGPGRMTREKRQ